MTTNDVDDYERVRQKLQVGPLRAPRHEKIIELMRVFWDEETIKVLSHFPPAGERVTLDTLVERTGMEKKHVRKLLSRAAARKTINKHVSEGYCLEPLLPGVFEAYFIAREDTPANLARAATLYREIFSIEAISREVWAPGFRFFRPVLPTASTGGLIEINEQVDAGTEVMPYELVEDMLSKNDHFAVIPCQCRYAGELAGEPCKVATPDMGCLATGKGAVMLAASGLATAMTRDEARAFLERTERAGLVHNTSNSKGGEHLTFICNCCSCHCGVLKPVKEHGIQMIQPGNFQPHVEPATCVGCEACVNACQMGAVSLGDDAVAVVDRARCIGCGACAFNCEAGAIKLRKVRNDVPPDKNKIGGKYFMQMLGELLSS